MAQFRGRRHATVGAPPVVPWRPATAQETEKAHDVIRRQLRAFRNDDYSTALSLLSPGMRGSSEKADDLRQIISGQHPEFAQVMRIRWLSAMTATDQSIFIRLRFFATNHNIIDVIYTLARSQGTYLISSINDRPYLLNMATRPTSPTSENSAIEQFFRSPDDNS